MARQRVQVGELQQERLRPAASPVDTFSPSPAGRTLEGLAKGLAAFAGPASQLAGTLADRYIARQQEQGKLGAREDDTAEAAQSIQEHNKAVKDGQLARGDNPWFRASYSEEKGRLEAQRWHSDFVIQSAQTLAEAENLEDFEKAVADHQAEWFKQHPGEDNQFFKAGFSNLATALTENERLRFASKAAQNVEKHAMDTYHAGIMGDVERMVAEGIKPAEIGKYVTQKARTAIGLGASGTAVNRATWQAVVRAAYALDDPLVAREILENVEGGVKGSVLARIPEAADAIEKASNDIAAEAHQRELWAEQAEKRHNEKQLDSLLGELGGTFEANLENPAGVNVDAFRRRAMAIDPSFGEAVMKMRNAYVTRTLEDDPLARAAAFVAVDGLDPDNPGHFLTKPDARDLLVKRKITVETYNSLIAKINERDTSGGAGKTLLDNDWLKRLTSDVQKAIAADIGESDPLYRYLSRVGGLRAAKMFQEWVAGGGDPNDPAKALAFVTDAFNSIYFTTMADKMNLKAAQKSNQSLGKEDEKLDWHKDRIAPNTQISLLRSDMQDIASGERESLSPGSLIILKRYNVPPEQAAEFIQAQEALPDR